MGSRVLLVDDQPVVLRGMASVLARGGHEVLGEAATGAEALSLAAALKPDVVLLDVRLPDMGGLEVLRRLRALPEPPRVLMFSAAIEPNLISEAIELGVDGYVGKLAAPEILVEAVTVVGRGEPFFCADALEALRKVGVSVLTKRELSVVRLIAEGLNSQKIGGQLGISVRTVETHRENILRKLQVSNVAGIVRFAVSAGLIHD